ncbi:MAG: hypothetical protein ACJAS1_002548 [Oleiphilaceae bacterium]|jgi:hypothetical protein
MAVHKVTARRATAAPTLKYIYRGDGHEHDVNLIKHIGGNILSPDPINRDELGLPDSVDIEQLAQEFEQQAKLHKGSGEKLFKHYIISLAPGESLEPHEWFEHINSDYLPSLGYDNTCRWVACQHDDKEHSHVHVFCCLSKGDGELVKTQDDVMLGFDSMRRLESKYNLKALENPSDNWGKHFTKEELKGYGSREEAEARDWGSIIRARFNAIESENGGKLPNTMTKLIIALANKSIEVKARQDDEGNIIGLSFKADDGPFLSASKIKKTRLTFKNIQVKEGVSYVPERDNAAFGIGNNVMKFNAAVKISESQYKRIKVLKPKLRVFRRNKKRYASFCFYDSLRARQVAQMVDAIMEILRALFEILTGIDLDEELVFYYAMEEAFEYEYQSKKENEYDLLDTLTAFNEIKNDHSKWIGIKQGPGTAEYTFNPIKFNLAA